MQNQIVAQSVAGNQTVLARMAEGKTANGALSFNTTGFDKFAKCLDYWTKAGTYTNRDQSVVDADMVRIFGDDEATALRIVFGLRLITRKPNDIEGISEVQTGYGRKDEFYKAVVWMHKNRSELLYQNLHLIPVFGSWKDLFTFPLVSLLNSEIVYALVKTHLDDSLLQKYLPTMRSESNIRTDRDRARVGWAKGLCKYLKISHQEYRRIKTSGTAHTWQRQMCQRDWDGIDFKAIPGKAMLLHTSQKGKDSLTVFERHFQIERLSAWVLSQDTIKFTGYPYELTRAGSSTKNPSLVQRLTYDKQFAKLLEQMKGHKLGNVLACLDTSGSMACEVMPGVSAYDICMSMGLVFSSLNVGHFKDAVVAFDSTSSLVKLEGDFCKRLHHIEKMTTARGSTNFQSVIDLLVRIRKNDPTIPVDQYPETLLVVSDMQFNPTTNDLNCRFISSEKQAETNYQAAMRKLREVGLGDIRIIWWNVNSSAGSDFPNQMNDKGVYMISGFDPVNIKALMGLEKPVLAVKDGTPDFKAAEKKEETPLDGMKNFLSQPIFGMLTV